MSSELAVVYGGFSTKGIKKENQDSFAAYQPTLGITRYKGIAACIADGVIVGKCAACQYNKRYYIFERLL